MMNTVAYKDTLIARVGLDERTAGIAAQHLDQAEDAVAMAMNRLAKIADALKTLREADDTTPAADVFKALMHSTGETSAAGASGPAPSMVASAYASLATAKGIIDAAYTFKG